MKYILVSAYAYTDKHMHKTISLLVLHNQDPEESQGPGKTMTTKTQKKIASDPK